MKNALGVGIGLRSTHYEHVLHHRPSVSWFEVISENFMGIEGGLGGKSLQALLAVREHYPVVLHGVSLSIGSVDPLDFNYLSALKELAHTVQPAWLSDHLCWTGADGHNVHDLLPLPFTEEALRHVSERVRRVQDFMGRQMMLENVSSYMTFAHSEMPEWEFVAEVARRSDCRILLDVNNVYVNARNHGFDASHYIDQIPQGRVGQMHLAGYADQGDHLLDTHDQPVTEPVWQLYEQAVRRFGHIPTLIEWDEKLPDFQVLAAEAARAERIQKQVLPHETKIPFVGRAPAGSSISHPA